MITHSDTQLYNNEKATQSRHERAQLYPAVIPTLTVP